MNGGGITVRWNEIFTENIEKLEDFNFKTLLQEIDEIKELQSVDKAKNKDKFQKINEALAVLERHLEQSNKKIGKVVAGEAASRKLHEKGLLSKLTDVEDRLAAYLSGPI